MYTVTFIQGSRIYMRMIGKIGIIATRFNLYI